MLNNNPSRIPIVESIQCHAKTEPPWAPAWRPDSPTLTLKELLKITHVSRSKAYELMKSDPDFPKGTPLYDGHRSPKIYFLSHALAWLEARSNKFLNQLKDD